MNNYKTDGWQSQDWREVVEYSKDLQRCATDLTTGIDCGRDIWEPADVIAVVERLDIIARRLRELSRDY